MSSLKCKNCQASIPPQSLKCDYCDTEVSIVDSAKNISAEGIAQTGKRLSKRVRPFLKKLGGSFLIIYVSFFCIGMISLIVSLIFQELDRYRSDMTVVGFCVFIILIILVLWFLANKKIKKKYIL